MLYFCELLSACFMNGKIKQRSIPGTLQSSALGSLALLLALILTFGLYFSQA